MIPLAEPMRWEVSYPGCERGNRAKEDQRLGAEQQEGLTLSGDGGDGDSV